MGNKSSSHSGESRGRSRSFNGLVSKFHRTSKSPPRDRSSSLSESSRPQRKGSGRHGQNGDVRSAQTSQSVRRGSDVPRLTPEKTAPVEIGIRSGEKVKQDLSSRLSKSAPGGRHPGPPAPVKKEIVNYDVPSTQSTLVKDNSAFIKSSNLKNLQKNQTSEKSELIENYSGSPRLGVSQMRQVSRELFSDQLEDLAKRRAKANLNRDLSLSNASLGLLSNRSKSMHSLSSCDYDYEERCNVGELLSFEHSYKVGELCRSITNQFSNDLEDGEESPLMRHRTNSASAIELGRHERKGVAMGATSVQMRRQLSSPTKSQLSQSAAENPYSAPTPTSQPEGNSARRVLVSRALKDISPVKSSMPSLTRISSEPQVSNPRSSLPCLGPSPVEPTERHHLPKRSSQPVLSQHSHERATSPRNTPERSLMPRSSRSLSPTSQYRASSPLSNNKSASPYRASSPLTNNTTMSEHRSSSPLTNVSASQYRANSPLSNNTSASNSPAKRPLMNLNKEQLLAANMTKSMQKFLLANPGVGTNSTDYEKLHNKIDKKKKIIETDVGRERSSSFSVLYQKTQEQQIVQRMIEEQKTEQKLKQQSIVHQHSHSYDSTPVSTGGDSGFRSRSQSWSSLSQKSLTGSKGHALAADGQNQMRSLLSYSVTSLLDSPSQPQRYFAFMPEGGANAETLSVNKGRYRNFFYTLEICVVRRPTSGLRPVRNPRKINKALKKYVWFGGGLIHMVYFDSNLFILNLQYDLF